MPNLTPIALCFPLRELGGGERQVLLGLKKTGMGVGRMVGLGGHIEAGESAAQAAVRELREECGIRASAHDVVLAGQVDFHFPARLELSMTTSMFTLERWEGEPAETEEIAPAWFDVDDLPFDQMWADAQRWVPLMLAGERLLTTVVMAEDNVSVARVHSVPLD